MLVISVRAVVFGLVDYDQISRRIGDFVSNDAAWSPDGNSLAFALGRELHFVSHDGTGDRIVARAPGNIIYPRWSPDGRRVRYSVSAAQSGLTIWEVSAGGSNPHPLDFQWSGTPMEGYGEWTQDGRFYIFASKRDGVSNLWAIEEETDWLHRRRLEPVQLTAGPINYSRPLPAAMATELSRWACKMPVNSCDVTPQRKPLRHIWAAFPPIMWISLAMANG